MSAHGLQIVKFEGRYQGGKLQHYKLPPGDGGGTGEVAGINEKYHGPKYRQLKALIEAGKHTEAEQEAALYIAEYTKAVLGFFPADVDPNQYGAIQFILRDTCFNRGPGGAAAVLQIALNAGLKVDAAVGPNTRKLFAEALKNDKEGLPAKLTKARETYERNSYPWKSGKRDESSKFWKGLANRWRDAHNASAQFA
jgi:lysozyme family protein